MATITHELMVCIDCTLAHANGKATESPDREPWCLFPTASVANACDNGTDGNDDCTAHGCTDFDSRSCDGCGSRLAGGRHAHVLFDYCPDAATLAGVAAQLMHDAVVREYGSCAACEAGEGSVHAYEHACECSEDYGPCELHCEVLAQREGASMRTADELAALFIDDAVDVGAEISPYGRDVVERVAAALDGPTDRGSWIEDDELRDELLSLVCQIEATLPDGVLVYWEDGYRIVTLTGGPLA